jgi:predicted nucleic acid-binding protein
VKNTYVIDANIILRYLLADHPEHFQQAKDFMDRVKDGTVGAFIPEGVLVECVHVLLKVYGFPRPEVAESRGALLRYRGIVNENLTILTRGLDRFLDHNVDIVDAIVYAPSTERGWPWFSFDQDMEKLGRK